ncbi:MAG: serpin family protein [Roseburia sp.]
MKKNMEWKKWMSLGMAGIIVTGSMAGCGSTTNVKLNNSTDLTKTVEKESQGKDTEQETQNHTNTNNTTTESFTKDTASFAVSLLQESMEEENVMVSPLSVLEALAMTANGAEGETAEQMQQVLGSSQTMEELNQNIHNWNEQLSGKETAKMNIANAIWFRGGDGENIYQFDVNQDFLEKNNSYYDAGIYESDFSEKTVEDINEWVKTKTDGKIDKLIATLNPEDIMCLVNAVSFESEWEEQYEEDDVWERDFTLESGDTKTMELMHSEESFYLEEDHAIGVRKPYKDGYSFVALLPEEGMDLDDYVASMTGEHFLETLEQEHTEAVITAIPKFTSEYSISLNDSLIQMGMPLAFDGKSADFSGIGDANENIYIGAVMHKTYIEVDEQGTKAAAATAVVMTCETAAIEPEIKEVILDRPFVYAIIEDETNLPVFLGVYRGV